MILTGLFIHSATVYADDLQFNTELLDISDKKNIESGLFSKPGYIMPGTYSFKISLNNQYLIERKVTFVPSKSDASITEACLTEDIVTKFALTKEFQKKLQWDPETNCLIHESIVGMTVKGNLPKAIIAINIPQAYLEYRSDIWNPPALWSEGINGVILDYNIAANSIFDHRSGGNNSTFASANGATGVNIGAWRLRADWQASYQHIENQNSQNQQNFNWNRFYAYRALPNLKSQLVLGLINYAA